MILYTFTSWTPLVPLLVVPTRCCTSIDAHIQSPDIDVIGTCHHCLTLLGSCLPSTMTLNSLIDSLKNCFRHPASGGNHTGNKPLITSSNKDSSASAGGGGTMQVMASEFWYGDLEDRYAYHDYKTYHTPMATSTMHTTLYLTIQLLLRQ